MLRKERNGWENWGPSDNSPVYMAAGLDYIDIPLQVRYRFSLAERVRLSLGLGGYLGYGFSGKQQVVYIMILTGLSWTWEHTISFPFIKKIVRCLLALFLIWGR